MKKNKIYQPDNDCNFWRDVVGYEGRYQVSRHGTIRRVFRSGVRDLHPYRRKGNRKLYVKLIDKYGEPHEITVLRIVSESWLGPVPDGMVAHHKNGLLSDNRADNIGYITRHELGKKTGKTSKSKTVFKIDRSGEVVEIYNSARQAAKANFCSYQTILDRCHNLVKNPYALDGFNYQFDFS
ncbi:MAG: NUMOD4 motif-containing HNH endonuclease [Clostridia bacterium]|nr:NUMOD4 motif-containing HNH endonuclease [Clostridia bacterium]